MIYQILMAKKLSWMISDRVFYLLIVLDFNLLEIPISVPD